MIDLITLTPMTVDLHLHTTHSDGTWKPHEMVEYAVEKMMRVISITDHDTTYGINEGFAAAKGRLEIIPGVEINTCGESGQAEKQDIHILGYFIDPSNVSLQTLLKRQRDARLEHVEKVIARLAARGVLVTMDSILSFTDGGPIGKPHITKAIVAVGGASDITSAYEKYMSKKSPYYVPRDSATPQAAIEAIRGAGGIASFAHPGDSAEISLVKLISYGLQAIEVYHQMHSEQTIEHLKVLASKYNLLTTGGSDCHGPYEECPPSLGTVYVPGEVVSELFAASSNSFLKK